MKIVKCTAAILSFIFCLFGAWPSVQAQDLDDVLRAGKLRHLGIVYANFITPDISGLDVELIRKFAEHLGVAYEFVETNWQDAIKDLTGKAVTPKGDNVEIESVGYTVKGDILASGFTILPWREKVVDFAETTFPTGIWLIAGAESPLTPVTPTGDMKQDIQIVKKSLNGYSVLGMKDSCLDPSLYGIMEYGAKIELFPKDRDLEEMIPAVMAKVSDTTLMDVPVALIAMENWPGKIKVVGPVSLEQSMAPAFAKESPGLRLEFMKFFHKLKESGEYKRLIEKYYPSLSVYYPEF